MTELLTTLTPAESDFELSRTEREFSSKFTEASQGISSPTGLWTVRLVFENLRRQDAQKLISTLWKLQGQTGSFKLYDWSAPAASGIGGEYSVTDYQHALPGKVFIITTHPQGTVIAKAGDYVSIDGELKGLTEDVIVDGANKAPLFFEPFMREPVTLTSKASFDTPTGIFKLKPGTKIPRKTSKKMVMSELTIECVERVTL